MTADGDRRLKEALAMAQLLKVDDIVRNTGGIRRPYYAKVLAIHQNSDGKRGGIVRVEIINHPDADYDPAFIASSVGQRLDVSAAHLAIVNPPVSPVFHGENKLVDYDGVPLSDLIDGLARTGGSICARRAELKLWHYAPHIHTDVRTAVSKASTLAGLLISFGDGMAELYRRKEYQVVGEFQRDNILPWKNGRHVEEVITIAHEIIHRTSEFSVENPQAIPGYATYQVQQLIAAGRIIALLEAD